jgi:hypothetical protein
MSVGNPRGQGLSRDDILETMRRYRYSNISPDRDPNNIQDGAVGNLREPGAQERLARPNSLTAPARPADPSYAASGSDEPYFQWAYKQTPDYAERQANIQAEEAALQAQRQAMRQRSMDQLRETASDALSNQDLRMRARKQVAPIYRPQIRNTKRNIRQTERQGRVSARQVQGYYSQAGQKVAGMAKGARKSTKRAIKGTMSGGVQGNSSANAESGIAAKAMKGMGKANASFFKQMQAALAGEGAVAAADTRRNYKDLANTYRSDLATLRSERTAAMQQVMQRMRGGINNNARTVYSDTYLGAIQQGMAPRKAQRVALAQAGTYSQAVEAKVAQMMLKNKGDEKMLARAQGKKPLTDEQWDRRQDRIGNRRNREKDANAQLEKLSTMREKAQSDDEKDRLDQLIRQQLGI